MKEFLILNDFTPVNASINKTSQMLRAMNGETEDRLSELKEKLSLDLAEMEKECAMLDNR